MTTTADVSPSRVTQHELTQLDTFAESLDEGDLRSLLTTLATALRGGDDVALMSIDAEYTPSQVAKRLRMSRTHLYKLLDSGQIPSHHVGRDRRIRGRDILGFEQQRQAERRTLAEGFAKAEAIRRAAVDELADEL